MYALRSLRNVDVTLNCATWFVLRVARASVRSGIFRETGGLPGVEPKLSSGSVYACNKKVAYIGIDTRQE